METELVTIDNTNYDMVAAAMGIEDVKPSSTNSANSLTRLRIWNKSVMGTIEKNGKPRQLEVVPGGTYRLDDSSGEYKYCENITLRPFLQRFRYNRWMPYQKPDKYGRSGKYIKSAFTSDYKAFNSSDIIDESGGFNCGRPSGFVKDWKELPEDTRKLITSVRRVRTVFGTVNMSAYLNEEGETVETDEVTIPVIWEIENNTKLWGKPLLNIGRQADCFLNITWSWSQRVPLWLMVTCCISQSVLLISQKRLNFLSRKIMPCSCTFRLG